MRASRTVLGWPCDGTMTGLGFSTVFLCRCHPVHFLELVLETTNHIHKLESVQPLP